MRDECLVFPMLRAGLDEFLTKFIKLSELIHIAAFMDINPLHVGRRVHIVSQSLLINFLAAKERERVEEDG